MNVVQNSILSAPSECQLNTIWVWYEKEKKTEIDCQGVVRFITCYKIFMVFIFTFYGMLENQFQFIVDGKN